MRVEPATFCASESRGNVSALFLRPDDARVLLVFGHGAGASMTHLFMERTAGLLAERAVATFRYNFPYMEGGRRAPDPTRILLDSVRRAVDYASSLAPDLPLLAGGKSMGGRMTSLAQSTEPLPDVRGLVFFGFPLHAPGKNSAERGDHLRHIDLPLLFLQGTRDRLADLTLLRPLVDDLADGTIHTIDDGDHSFKVPKRAGRSYDEVLVEVANVVGSWSASRSGLDGE